MEKKYSIRYVKLHFTLRMLEDTELPLNKPSALRGGMGEMLLRANCIRDRDCENCDFESECIVRRTMYSKMEIEPKFMSAGDSVGYVIECEDYRTDFNEGDELKFNLILFGKTIVYFSQYMNAFYALGMNGLGKKHSKFVISEVTNSRNRPLLRGSDIDMGEYQVSTLADYVSFRKKQIMNPNSGVAIPALKLKLQSPLTMKYRGEYLQELKPEALIEALYRRAYMLDCFEGIEAESKPPEEIRYPEITSQNMKPVNVQRYSFRKNEKMNFSGIEGVAFISDVTENVLDYLLAGELIHIGKNSSFGFGRFHISKEGE